MERGTSVQHSAQSHGGALTPLGAPGRHQSCLKCGCGADRAGCLDPHTHQSVHTLGLGAPWTQGKVASLPGERHQCRMLEGVSRPPHGGQHWVHLNWSWSQRPRWGSSFFLCGRTLEAPWAHVDVWELVTSHLWWSSTGDADSGSQRKQPHAVSSLLGWKQILQLQATLLLPHQRMRKDHAFFPPPKPPSSTSVSVGTTSFTTARWVFIEPFLPFSFLCTDNYAHQVAMRG